MEARQISVQLRRDPREIAERHSQANPLTLSCVLARGETVEQNLSLYAELHTSRTPASVPLAASGPVAMTTGGTGPWELDFSSAQMNQTVLPGEDVEFWLVVYATSATSEVFTLATIRLTLQYDNISQIIPPPPEPSIAGNVFGPASATDNALARFDGTTGKLLQNSAATLTDAGLLTVPDAAVTGTLTAPHIHGNLAGSIYSHVRNESGGLLTKGTPVYVSGFSVGQSRPLVSAANAASAATMPAIGILDDDLANNANGHCVILGTIENLNTAAYSVNAPLYVASGGGLTATAPSVRAQSIAVVERANANTGAIIVTAADVSGSMAQQASDAVSITGGTITGLTNLTSTIGTFSTSLAVTSSTASTSASTGALVVAGGVGIGGALNVGADSFLYGVRAGRGSGAAPSNTAFGAGALASVGWASVLTISNAGSGGVTGPTTYNGVQLTYVSGPTATTYPTVNITVTGGVVTAITVVTGGAGFETTGTVLTASPASIGGLTGFQATVSTLLACDFQTAVGVQALAANYNGRFSTGVGNGAARSITTAQNTTAIGTSALQNCTVAASNTAVGSSSLLNISTGATSTSGQNVSIGHNSGRYEADKSTALTSAANSVFIGHNSGPAASSQTNQVVIGQNATGDGSNTTVIGTTSTTQSRIYGGDAFNTGANGQSNVFGQATVLLSAFTGATRTATALIPANCIVIGVSARVTTAITGATSFDIGDGTTANLFADDVAVALGSTSNLVIDPKVYATATNVVCTANGSNFTAGAVRLTVHYMRIVAPTS